MQKRIVRNFPWKLILFFVLGLSLGIALTLFFERDSHISLISTETESEIVLDDKRLINIIHKSDNLRSIEVFSEASINPLITVNVDSLNPNEAYLFFNTGFEKTSFFIDLKSGLPPEFTSFTDAEKK